MISKATVLRLLAAIVAILTIAVVASVLPNVIESGGSGGISDVGNGQSNASSPAPPPTEPTSELPLQIIMAVLLALFVVGTIWMVLYDRRELLRFLKRMAVATVVVGILVLAVTTIMDQPGFGPMENSTGTENGTGSGEPGLPGGDQSETASEETNLVTLNNVLLLAIVLGGLVGVGYILRRYRNRSEGDAGQTLPEATPGDEVAIVAGATADRIQSDDEAAVENEVYRAWKRMTELLDVAEPATSTPGEFAAAAIDAGFEPAAVDELTSLFETVRYGPTTASDLEAERAVAILRRLESATDTTAEAELTPGEYE